MRVGQFFSLKKGRVGQYLSSRVLVVRTPFQQTSDDNCYFGFKRFTEAQKFAQYLAAMGHTFQLRRSQILPQSYEICLRGNSDLARKIAYWDRVDNRWLSETEAKAQVDAKAAAMNPGSDSAPTFAA